MPDLVPFTAHQALVAAGDMAAIISDNFQAGEGIAFRDLTRYKLGAGGATMFARTQNTLEGGEEETHVAGFEAIVVDRRDQRAFWAQPLGQGESRNPDCKSADGVYGSGNNGTGSTGRHECATCPMNQFGSKVGMNGQAGRGKGCKQTRLFFLLTPSDDSIFPSVLQVPPASLGNLRAYAAALTTNRKSMSGSVHRFSLEKAKNGDGIAYAKLKLSFVRDLQPEEREKLGQYREAMLGMIQRFGAQAVEEEVRQEQSGEGFPAGPQHSAPVAPSNVPIGAEPEFEIVSEKPRAQESQPAQRAARGAKKGDQTEMFAESTGAHRDPA